jgi:O-antigen ligase
MTAMSSIRFRIVTIAYAVWLFGVWGAFYLGHGKDVNLLQVAVMGGAIPALCQIFLLGVDGRGLMAPTKIWLAYILVILLSYVVNVMNPLTAPSGNDGSIIPAAWTPIVYTLNAAFIMGVSTLVAGCPDRRLLRSVAAFYCVVATPFLVYVDLTGKFLWGRLYANNLQPNNWGLMGLTVCVAALARKRGPVAIVSFAVGLETILLASSREHLLALAIVLLVWAALSFPTMKGSRLLLVMGGSCAALIAAALLLDPYILQAIKYVESDILLFNSPDRGLGSGFTGRAGVWKETVDLWLRSPLLGFGYRQHERFLSGTPAHNSFLAVLADTGVLGLIVYLVLMIGSLIASWKIEEPRTRRFVVGIIVSYIIVGFFDRRTIDAGNPFSLFYLMCCSVALTDHSLRKVSVLYRKLSARQEQALAADPRLPTG